MLNRCFQAQVKSRAKRDWVTTILEDLKYVDMENVEWNTALKSRI